MVKWFTLCVHDGKGCWKWTENPELPMLARGSAGEPLFFHWRAATPGRLTNAECILILVMLLPMCSYATNQGAVCSATFPLRKSQRKPQSSAVLAAASSLGANCSWYACLYVPPINPDPGQQPTMAEPRQALARPPATQSNAVPAATGRCSSKGPGGGGMSPCGPASALTPAWACTWRFACLYGQFQLASWCSSGVAEGTHAEEPSCMKSLRYGTTERPPSRNCL